MSVSEMVAVTTPLVSLSTIFASATDTEASAKIALYVVEVMISFDAMAVFTSDTTPVIIVTAEATMSNVVFPSRTFNSAASTDTSSTVTA